MGICISKNAHRKVSVDPKTNESCTPLEKIRADLIIRIHNLHTVKSSCKQGVEICAIQKEKSKAIILRTKQEYISLKLKEIQNMIKIIDETKEKSNREKLLVVDIAAQIEGRLDPLLIRDDIDQIILEKENLIYNDVLKKTSLTKEWIDVANQVEQIFESPIYLNEPISGGIRRKYNRRTKSFGKPL